MSDDTKLAPKAEPERKITAIDVFKGTLSRYENDLRALLEMHNMSPQNFITTTLNAVKKTPALLDCDPKTLFASILVSAELGLTPNTTMGFAHILPYKRKYKDKQGNWQEVLEAQFQIGYPGWLEIMYRNPKIESIETGVIYENEAWSFDKGRREPFSHSPLSPKLRGDNWVAVFGIAWLANVTRPKVIVLYREDIEKIMKLSQGANSSYSPWKDTDKDPFLWMPRKTTLKQLVKELPKTKEVERIVNIDNVVETGGTVRLGDDDRTVDTIDTGYMEHLNKLERIEEKSETIASAVKSMMPNNAGKTDKDGQTKLI